MHTHGLRGVPRAWLYGGDAGAAGRTGERLRAGARLHDRLAGSFPLRAVECAVRCIDQRFRCTHPGMERRETGGCADRVVAEVALLFSVATELALHELRGIR